jgi:PhzF family phenazine biosynthesis protein
MKIKLYQIDAFTSRLFSGNPAAVCPLDEWLPAETMQNIAMENNLAETAFVVKSGEEYAIRWFTPAVEVDLCGHATLAAAYVLFHHEGHRGNNIRFDSARSGLLPVTKQGELLTLDFPYDPCSEVELLPMLTDGFNIAPVKAFKGKTDYMLVYRSEAEIKALAPDFRLLGKIDARGIIVTAPGDKADFVSRFFAPQCGIDEDPVTGSAHTTLTPYWAGVLGKLELSALQLSRRGGSLHCRLVNDRVQISGEARLYLRGEIIVD